MTTGLDSTQPQLVVVPQGEVVVPADAALEDTACGGSSSVVVPKTCSQRSTRQYRVARGALLASVASTASLATAKARDQYRVARGSLATAKATLHLKTATR